MIEFRPITPHIWRLNLQWDLKIPFYPPIPVAVWLVKDADEWTLVDTGAPAHTSIMMESVSRFLGAAKPSRIVLTHAHYDHGGGLIGLSKQWGLPIWAHALEADFVAGANDYRKIDSQSAIYNLSKRILTPSVWRVPVARALNEGDKVSGMDVIHVPGHTPGMIALHHRADRAIICSDTFMNLGGKLSEPLAMSTPDPAEARRSMKKIAALDFDTLLPSHDPSERGASADSARRFASRF